VFDPKVLLSINSKYESVYKTEICDETFIWRELTKDEFEKAKRFYPNEEEREEHVCRLCVISPVDYDYTNCYAGIPTTMTILILKESGFMGDSSRSMLNYYRSEAMNFEHQIAPMICAAFPKFDLDEINGWTVRKTLYYMSRAEWMLSTMHGVTLTNESQEQPIDYDAFPELRKMKNDGSSRGV